MPTLFTKLYCRSAAYPDNIVILDNVTGHQIGEWAEREGWYRDLPVAAGSVGHVVPSGTFTDYPIVPLSVPVMGVPGEAPTAVNTTTAAKLRFVGNDEQTHTPPRSRVVLHSGHIYAVGDVIIPQFSLPALPAVVRTFTVDATSNVVTTATAHALQQGDTLALMTTNALPAGLVATTVYTAVILTDTTLLLRNAATGAVADITGTGTGVHTLALIDRVERYPITPNVAGVFRFSDLHRWTFSTSDPR